MQAEFDFNSQKKESKKQTLKRNLTAWLEDSMRFLVVWGKPLLQLTQQSKAGVH
jgi:hypothetical protein